MGEFTKKESEIIGLNIKKARKKKRWSIADLSRESGINRQTINRIEIGAGTPQQNTIEVISLSLGVSIQDLKKPNFIADEALNSEVALNKSIQLEGKMNEIMSQVVLLRKQIETDPLITAISKLSEEDQKTIAKAINQNADALIIFCKTLIK